MKKNKTIVFLCCACLILTGCMDNSILVSEGTTTTDEDSRIRLFIPNATEVLTYSTATSRENYIDSCAVITFDAEGNKKNDTIIVADNITNNGKADVLLPQLPFEIKDGDKVYVICNTELTRAILNSVTTEDDINDIKPEKDYYFVGDALPMSGKIDSWEEAASVITLTRAVAKIQIKLGDTYTKGGNVEEGGKHVGAFDWDTFEERNCGFFICNYAGKSDIMASSSSSSSSLSANQPLNKAPFYGIHERALRFMQYAATEDSMAIYVSEYPNSKKDCTGATISPADTFNTNRLFLLMVDRVFLRKT